MHNTYLPLLHRHESGIFDHVPVRIKYPGHRILCPGVALVAVPECWGDLFLTPIHVYAVDVIAAKFLSGDLDRFLY